MERKAVQPRRTRAADAAPPARAHSPVTQLQRTIGNRATGRVLSRQPSSYVVDYADLGALPLESFSMARPGEKEVVFVTKPGAHSTKLMNLANRGKASDAHVYGPTHDITFKGAIVSSYQQSSHEGEPTEQWSLSFSDQKIDYH